MNIPDILKKMIDGCDNVYHDPEIHKDAKDLAKFVIRDCRKILTMIEGELSETL